MRRCSSRSSARPGCCCWAWRWRSSPASSWPAAWWCRSRPCGGRGAHRQGRSRPAHLDQDRRRARRARRPVQRHGRQAAGILRRPREEGRGPHPRAGAIGRRAARARRGQPGGQLDARPGDRALTIVPKAAQLSGTEAGAIYELNEASGEFQLRATYGMDDDVIAAINEHHADISEVGRAVDASSGCRSRFPTCARSRPRR